MTTLSKKLNTQIVKAHIPSVQAAIKDLLKVDAGKQAAYHIFAVSNFLKNDQQLKGILKKSTYEVTTNLGTSENPCTISHIVGDFEFDYEGKQASEMFLRNCELKAEWNILKDGELLNVDNSYLYTIRTMPRPKKGLTLTVSVQGNRFSDLSDSLEFIKQKVDDESPGWEDQKNRYSFEIFGDEYDDLYDVKLSNEGDEFILLDSNRVFDRASTIEHITSTLENEELKNTEHCNCLVCGEKTDIEEALTNDDDSFFAISTETSEIVSGDIYAVLGAIQEESSLFTLYKVIEIN